jgi:hypothetical protein
MERYSDQTFPSTPYFSPFSSAPFHDTHWMQYFPIAFHPRKIPHDPKKHQSSQDPTKKVEAESKNTQPSHFRTLDSQLGRFSIPAPQSALGPRPASSTSLPSLAPSFPDTSPPPRLFAFSGIRSSSTSPPSSKRKIRYLGSVLFSHKSCG